MNILRAVELLFLALSVLVVATQCIVPLWRGEPVFPLLRGRGAAERELREARGVWQEKRVKAETRRVVQEAKTFDKESK